MEFLIDSRKILCKKIHITGELGASRYQFASLNIFSLKNSSLC